MAHAPDSSLLLSSTPLSPRQERHRYLSIYCATAMGFLFNKPADVPGSAAPAILVGMFVAFGGVLFGYDTGTIGGILAMPYWRSLFSTGYINPADDFPDVTSSQKSEIVSILSAGTFFGALFSAPIADFLGRRMGMIFNTGVFTVGVVLQTIATAIPMFVAGRFFAGLGVGLLSGKILHFYAYFYLDLDTFLATIPLYQSETSPKWIRGSIVGCYQVFPLHGYKESRIDSGSSGPSPSESCLPQSLSMPQKTVKTPGRTEYLLLYSLPFLSSCGFFPKEFSLLISPPLLD